MGKETNFKYYAFISYKREDEEWAKWLQHKLEHYKLPSNLNGRTDLPKEIRPIFRDQSDLAGGVLADEINNALECSKYLIVICSPRSAQSEWVGKEVKTFMDLGRTDKIIPFIIGGTAYAQEPKDECFPLALRELPSHQELLGVNINEIGRDAAAVKVVAQMFGLKFDELWQRHEREQRRKRLLIIVAALLLALTGVGVAVGFSQQDKRIKAANWQMMENQARFVAEKASNLVDEGDSYLARLLAVEVLPDDKRDANKPYTPEAEIVLREASKHNTAILHGQSYFISAFVSPDGKQIVSTIDSTIVIWDVETGKKVMTLNGHKYDVWHANYSPNGKYIVSASSDETIRIWNAKTGKELNKLTGHTHFIYSASFSPNEKYIVSASSDRTIRIWDSETGTELKTIHVEADSSMLKNYNWNEVLCVAYSPDGKRIVSTSRDQIIRIWDAETGKEIRRMTGHSDEISSAAFSPDGKQILSTSVDGTVRLWDAKSGEELSIMKRDGRGVSFASYSFDGKRIVSTCGNDIVLWDAETHEILATLEGHSASVNTAAFSPDGRRIVSASMDNTIRIWDIDSISDFKTMDIHSDSLQFAYHTATSPDGEHFITTKGNTIFIKDTKTKEEILTLSGHTNHISSTNYSADGKLIVSSSYDHTIRIWDATTGEEKRTLTGHTSFVFYAGFSPDGKYVVSTASDKTVRVWDTSSGKQLLVLEGQTSYVRYAAFTHDGRQIYATCEDGTVRIWDFPPLQELIDQTRERFKDRPLTPEERRMYYLK